MSKQRRAWFITYQWDCSDGKGWTTHNAVTTMHPVEWLVTKITRYALVQEIGRYRLLFYREIDPKRYDVIAEHTCDSVRGLVE